MYQKEKQILILMISFILIPLLYALHIYNKFIADNPDLLNDFQFIAKKFLIMVPIMVGSLIVIYIIFAIIHKIVTNEEMSTLEDERDKLIELKALRISHRSYGFGFLLAIISQAAGMEPWVLLITIMASCFIGAIAESIAKIYYYRKGV